MNAPHQGALEPDFAGVSYEEAIARAQALVPALRERAARSDGKLWEARALIILADAEQRGLSEGVEPLRMLAAEFRNVPEMQEQLARVKPVQIGGMS